MKEALIVYKGKRVFITGHTGFKGSWLAKWMLNLGATVYGYSLDPNTSPNHFSLLDLEMNSSFEDIRDKEKLLSAIESFQPDIVFHLAAQPLVRYSYFNPSETYETNVIGTLNVLEACKKVKSVRAVLSVTTDKVYENKESIQGYKETDRLGGYDPYSSSKACSEILTSSYVNSFLNLDLYGKDHNVLVATARGGNVIGGGDWSEDRLIPDIISSAVQNTVLDIRKPSSIRPWQHVLDCLLGYIEVGSRLLIGEKAIAGSWNFGPTRPALITVKDIFAVAQKRFPNLIANFGSSDLHETQVLQLNCEKAIKKLNWRPILSNKKMFDYTFDWYLNFYDKNEINTDNQLKKYTELLLQESK